MNSHQQQLPTLVIKDEKEETSTQAGSHPEDDLKPFIQACAQIVPTLHDQLTKQHQICSKVTASTFSADKLIRLLSSVLKLIRTYSLSKNLKSIQKLSTQIGQLRRLLRIDRLFLISKDYLNYSKKQHLHKHDKFLIVFKTLLVFGDLHDIAAYLIQMKVIPGMKKITFLRQRVADIYFIECLGWLIYHTYQYFKSDTDEGRYHNQMIIVRYLLDTIVTYNDFSQRRFTMDAKLSTAINFISSLLNLSLIWK